MLVVAPGVNLAIGTHPPTLTRGSYKPYLPHPLVNPTSLPPLLMHRFWLVSDLSSLCESQAVHGPHCHLHHFVTDALHQPRLCHMTTAVRAQPVVVSFTPAMDKQILSIHSTQDSHENAFFTVVGPFKLNTKATH